MLTFALSDDGDGLTAATILVGDDELGIYLDEVSVHVLYVYLLCVSLAFCISMTYSFLYYL